MWEATSRIRFEVVAAALAWSAVALPVVVNLGMGSLEVSARSLGWVAAWLAFGAIFFPIASRHVDHYSYTAHLGLLAGMTFIAITALALLPEYRTTAILLILTSTVAAYLLQTIAAVAWIGFQAGAMLLVLLIALTTPSDAWFESAAYLSFMIFAYLTTRSSLSEAEAREELAQRNRELRATRFLLAESQRTAERARISRDLHDLLGRTLSLIAVKSALVEKLWARDGERALRESREVSQIADDALREVRNAVSMYRTPTIEGELANARTALETVGTTLHEEVEQATELADGVQGTIAFVIREAVTNIVRHSDASKCYVRLHTSSNNLVLEVEDNGSGSIDETGHGIRGMRERTEAAGGTLGLESANGNIVRVTVPVDAGNEPTTLVRA